MQIQECSSPVRLGGAAAMGNIHAGVFRGVEVLWNRPVAELELQLLRGGDDLEGVFESGAHALADICGAGEKREEGCCAAEERVDIGGCDGAREGGVVVGCVGGEVREDVEVDPDVIEELVAADDGGWRLGAGGGEGLGEEAARAAEVLDAGGDVAVEGFGESEDEGGGEGGVRGDGVV